MQHDAAEVHFDCIKSELKLIICQSAKTPRGRGVYVSPRVRVIMWQLHLLLVLLTSAAYLEVISLSLHTIYLARVR